VFKRGAKLPIKQRLGDATLDLADAISALEGVMQRRRA
jgi:hypothetical protein